MDEAKRDNRQLLSQIFGKLTALEYLLELSWANAIADGPFPVATAQRFVDDLKERADDTYGDPGSDADMAYSIALYSAEYTANFGEKVLKRITEAHEKGQLPRRE